MHGLHLRKRSSFRLPHGRWCRRMRTGVPPFFSPPLGWVPPSAGGSLAIPTLIVFGIGCAIAIAWWIGFRDWAVVASVIAITIGASIWTFAFSVPASVTWGSSATLQAQSAISRLGSSPTQAYGDRCSNIETGAVGPIDAPYRQCTGFTPSGGYVIFTAASQTTRGLVYADRGGVTFGNECSRHLVGKWWMFTAETSGEGACPIGYQFQGSG
jgi:hypothetical protein